MKNVKNMNVEQINDELKILEDELDSLYNDEEFDGHCGSPGEWLFERMDELKTELKRRVAII